jgi:hypothetical protein
MLELLTTVTIGRPISAETALNPDLPNDVIVVCTMAQAVRLLSQGPPRLPIVVKKATERG